MKSQRLTELRRQIWDDRQMMIQPDSILQEQLDRFAELIIEDCLDLLTRSEKVATQIGQTERSEALRELIARFKEKYDLA